MTSLGRDLRLNRLADPAGNYLLVPMDHGLSDGPVQGLVDVNAAAQATLAGGATGLIVHKGIVRRVAPALREHHAGLLVHISASTNQGDLSQEKVTVTTAKEAVALGADALSLHLNVGSITEDRQLTAAGAAIGEAHTLGLPVLVMAYLRGPKVADPFSPEGLAHCARLAEELGADLVKVPYPGDQAGFAKIVEGVSIPVLIAGGPRLDSPQAFLKLVEAARTAGARGISVGRNIWATPDPTAIMGAVRRIMSEGETASRASRLL